MTKIGLHKKLCELTRNPYHDSHDFAIIILIFMESEWEKYSWRYNYDMASLILGAYLHMLTNETLDYRIHLAKLRMLRDSLRMKKFPDISRKSYSANKFLGKVVRPLIKYLMEEECVPARQAYEMVIRKMRALLILKEVCHEKDT